MKKFLFTSIVLFLSIFLSHQLEAQNWTSLDASTYDAKGKKYHFFYGKYYVTKNRGQNIDGYPKLISEGWKGFPSSWYGGYVDAVVYSQDNDAYYFFRGDEYARKPRGKAFDKGPIKLNASNSGFKGIPWDNVDAVCYNSDTKTYYFFKGNQYVSKKRGQAIDSNIKIAGRNGWRGFPYSKGVRAVAYSPDNQAYYFFTDTDYARKKKGENFTSSYPRSYAAQNSGFKWSERSNENFVGLIQEAGFIVDFEVSWTVNGSRKYWKKSGQAIGFNTIVKIPKNAINIDVIAYAHTFINTKKKLSMYSSSAPPNKYFKVYGTIFEPSYTAQSSGTGVIEGMSNYVKKEVVDGVAKADETISQAINNGIEQIIKAHAVEDLEKYGDLIKALSQASKNIKNESSSLIGQLTRAAKSKNPDVAKDAMQTLGRSNAFKPVIDWGRQNNFNSLSFNVSAGASAVIGTDGAFGFAIGIPSLVEVKGFAGVGGSLGIQAGGSADAQFGIWNASPNNLKGPFMSCRAETSAGVGGSVTIVYDLSTGSPKLVGIIAGPTVGAENGFAIGGGYTWVY